MKRYVTDILGKKLEVTDLEAGIKQAEMYSSWEDTNAPKDVNDLAKGYWTDLLNKLKELKKTIEAEPKPEAINDPIANNIPTWVKEIREKYPVKLDNTVNAPNPNIIHKLFSKDREDSPLYGAHSCVRTLQNLNTLDKLEVGETWDRGYGVPSLTRIF